MTLFYFSAGGRTDGNFCGRRRRGRGPADGAPAAAAAAAKIEKNRGPTDGFFSGRPEFFWNEESVYVRLQHPSTKKKVIGVLEGS